MQQSSDETTALNASGCLNSSTGLSSCIWSTALPIDAESITYNYNPSWNIQSKLGSLPKQVDFSDCTSSQSILSQFGYPNIILGLGNFYYPIDRETKRIVDIWKNADSIEEFLIQSNLSGEIDVQLMIALTEFSFETLVNSHVWDANYKNGLSKNFFGILDTGCFDSVIMSDVFIRHWVCRLPNLTKGEDSGIVNKLLELILEKKEEKDN